MRLWNEEYPEQLQHKDMDSFNAYLQPLQEQAHILLIGEDVRVYGWAFTFTRDGERWFAIVLDSAIQQNGFGKFLIDKLKAKETRLCGWVTDHSNDKKQNGEPYRSPMNFYLKNNFVVLPDCRLESEKLSAVKVIWEKVVA